MTDEADILILGAGAAGLAAARELSFSKLNVIVRGRGANTTGHGTVHAAIQSGLRAAQKIQCSPGIQV